MAQPLSSMTGYARAGGVASGVTFGVEIKSVNARGLDIRMRLTPGYDVLESEFRRRIAEAITRGSITLSLNVERQADGGPLLVNEAALATVIAAIGAINERLHTEPPTATGILGLPGVLRQQDTAMDEDAEAALHAAILGAVDTALADLLTVRKAEGTRLTAVLSTRIDEIAALAKLAEDHPGRSREVILERLRQQVAELTAAGSGVAEDRLAQEALLLATKADIREELDRLAAHVASARHLLAAGGPVGRKLDFLSQEFNREANTLCSKSNAVDLTSIGLDLKAVIDQLREQVQNIE